LQGVLKKLKKLFIPDITQNRAKAYRNKKAPAHKMREPLLLVASFELNQYTLRLT